MLIKQNLRLDLQKIQHGLNTFRRNHIHCKEKIIFQMQILNIKHRVELKKNN